MNIRLVVAVVVILAVLSVVCVWFPEFGVGVVCGVGVCLGLFWFLKPVYDRWVLERKKRRFVALKAEVVRLEKEVFGK